MDDDPTEFVIPAKEEEHTEPRSRYTISYCSPPEIMETASTAIRGRFSVLRMKRVRGTALDWFRHTLYSYT